jgi:hypothetical protein
LVGGCELSGESERPLSPIEMMKRLESTGVWLVYYDFGIRGNNSNIVMSGNIKLYPVKGVSENEVLVRGVLFSKQYMAEFNCQTRKKRCIQIERWSLSVAEQAKTNPVWQKVYSKLAR